MRKIAILSILILALLAVSVAFAAEMPEMSVYVADINVGEIAHVQITLPSDAQGNVTVSVDGQNYSANVVDGKANVDLPNLKAGDYVVNVTYPGSGNYSQIEKQADLKVSESNNNASDTNTSANASGAPDTNTSANASGAPSTNTTPVTPTNVTNTTDTANNTNVTPQKNTTNNTAPAKPKKEPPKPLAGLEDKNTGLPILLLILVVIIVVIGVALRGRK